MKGCIFKFLILFVALIVLVSLGIRIRYRDIPEPDLSELSMDRIEVSDEENAYTYFRRAYAESSLKNDREILNSSLDEIEDKNEVLELFNRNREMHELLDVGLAKEICLVPQVTDLNSMQPYLSEWRNFSAYLKLLADVRVSENKLSEANKTLITLFRFGDLTSAHPETLIQYLLGMSPKRLALSAMSDLALHPELTPHELMQMAMALQEAGSNKDAAVRALKAEFEISCNMIDEMARAPLTLSEFSKINSMENEFDLMERIPLPRLLLQPNRTKQKFRDTYLRVIHNFQLPYAEMDNPENSYLMPYRGWRSMMRENGLGDLLYMILLPALDSVLESHIKFETKYASVQLVIALQRYQRDFGKFPDRLDSLVPEYLEQLPANPFNGEPFQYDLENKILYIEGAAHLEGDGESVKFPFARNPDSGF